MTSFQIFSFISILLVSLAGGYFPILKAKKTEPHSLSAGKAFTSGVFLALSLTVMLPSAFALWQEVLKPTIYPMATYIAVAVFIVLLAIEHRIDHLRQDSEPQAAIIPIVMTLMIGLCSLLLGTALGVSDTLAAVMIFIAIIAHKGSASFALALTMVKSKLTQFQTYLAFGFFALATPLGIVVGSSFNHLFSGHALLLFKAIVMSIASGVFLYLATTYGLRHTPFVTNCRNKKGFLLMIVGLVITLFVSVLLSYAQHLGQ